MVVVVVVVLTTTFRGEVASETSLDLKTMEVITMEVITMEVITMEVITTEVEINHGPKTTKAEIRLEVIITEVAIGAVVLIVTPIKVESMGLKVRWDEWLLQVAEEAVVVAAEPALN